MNVPSHFRSIVRPAAGTIAVCAAALVLAACGSSASPTGPTPGSSQPTAPPLSPTPATVSIALSWTPNTDYTGVYVAEQQGLYAAQGLTVEILPYAETAPETLVARGAADFGFSYQAGVAYARAAGQDIVAVFAPMQRGTYAIGVSADRADITRPRDLDGKVYAGFGTPDELPLLRTVIRNDGGKGEFTNVTLNTSAYEAVRSGAADFTIPVATWEGVAAELAGKPMKLFSPTDYGFPDQYSSLIISSGSFLSANPDAARRFIQATQAGYAFAAANPAQAAKDIVAANPSAFPDEKLVLASEQRLADGGYLTDAQGRVGYQQVERWQQYGGFLFDNGLLVDEAGKPLTAEPDWQAAFSNDYLS